MAEWHPKRVGILHMLKRNIHKQIYSYNLKHKGHHAECLVVSGWDQGCQNICRQDVHRWRGWRDHCPVQVNYNVHTPFIHSTSVLVKVKFWVPFHIHSLSTRRNRYIIHWSLIDIIVDSYALTRLGMSAGIQCHVKLAFGNNCDHQGPILQPPIICDYGMTTQLHPRISVCCNYTPVQRRFS